MKLHETILKKMEELHGDIEKGENNSGISFTIMRAFGNSLITSDLRSEHKKYVQETLARLLARTETFPDNFNYCKYLKKIIKKMEVSQKNAFSNNSLERIVSGDISPLL